MYLNHTLLEFEDVIEDGVLIAFLTRADPLAGETQENVLVLQLVEFCLGEGEVLSVLRCILLLIIG